MDWDAPTGLAESPCHHRQEFEHADLHRAGDIEDRDRPTCALVALRRHGFRGAHTQLRRSPPIVFNASIIAALFLRVPMIYATCWYSWTIPPARSRRWTRSVPRSITLSSSGRSSAAWPRALYLRAANQRQEALHCVHRVAAPSHPRVEPYDDRPFRGLPLGQPVHHIAVGIGRPGHDAPAAGHTGWGCC